MLREFTGDLRQCDKKRRREIECFIGGKLKIKGMSKASNKINTIYN